MQYLYTIGDSVYCAVPRELLSDYLAATPPT